MSHYDWVFIYGLVIIALTGAACLFASLVVWAIAPPKDNRPVKDRWPVSKWKYLGFLQLFTFTKGSTSEGNTDSGK